MIVPLCVQVRGSGRGLRHQGTNPGGGEVRQQSVTARTRSFSLEDSIIC